MYWGYPISKGVSLGYAISEIHQWLTIHSILGVSEKGDCPHIYGSFPLDLGDGLFSDKTI
jgi:hypothetical protein